MLNPQKIVIHHSLTDDSRTLSWAAIQDYHINTKGWSDIGYHAGIEQVGDHFVCLFGRPDVLPGAHTLGHNGSSLGFCFVGNFDHAEPGRLRYRVAARRILAPWLLRYGLTVDALVPHSQFASKSCPGKLFSMNELREITAEELDVLRDRAQYA